MENVAVDATRVGDPQVLAFFEEFLSADLIDRDRFPTAEDGDVIVAGVRGGDRFRDFCRFACEGHTKVTFAVVPTTKMPPLVVFTLQCADPDPDGCLLHDNTDFDTLLAYDLHCPSWERDGRTFQTKVLWPKDFTSHTELESALAERRPDVLAAKRAQLQLGFDLTGKA